MSLHRMTAIILGAAVAGAALGHTRGLRSGMAIGYAYGDRDGQRRGDANARLNAVLAEPTEARHYADVVGQLPGACDSLTFADVLLNGGLREGLHEGAFPWEGPS